MQNSWGRRTAAQGTGVSCPLQEKLLIGRGPYVLVSPGDAVSPALSSSLSGPEAERVLKLEALLRATYKWRAVPTASAGGAHPLAQDQSLSLASLAARG